MIYIVPSRGRPQNAADLITAWTDLTYDSKLVFVLNDDDPTLDAYMEIVTDDSGYFLMRSPARSMVEALNWAALQMTDDFVGFMGDDHRPRTKFWDSSLETRMKESGALIAYGNDLIQGPALPTAVLLNRRVITANGYMAPPVLRHLYVDNYWRALGEGVGSLMYCGDVVIEHVHPIAGKAEWDDGYARVNAGHMYEQDRAAWDAFVADGSLARDIERVGRVRV